MTRPPLRIFSDQSYIPPNVRACPMLKPFWGDASDHGGYAKFTREGREFLSLADPSEADIAVLPFDGTILIQRSRDRRPAEEQARRFVETARAAGLRTIVMVNTDVDDPIELPDVIVFRTSLSRRTRRENEFALPAWHEDLVEDRLGGRLAIQDRPERPLVGFCGLAATSEPTFRRRIKMLMQRAGGRIGWHIPHNDGIYLRRRAMQVLERDPRVDTRFIVRDKYFGGALARKDDLETVRRDYLNNLVDCGYSLCARGYGNFSFRFFEALLMGRIPVLIDTDCVLPFDFLIDYSPFLVKVPEHRIGRCAELTLDFHSRLSDEGYRDLQRRIREFWVEWLSPQGFMRNLALHRERIGLVKA